MIFCLLIGRELHAGLVCYVYGLLIFFGAWFPSYKIVLKLDYIVDI
jgi:hypothetical protein